MAGLARWADAAFQTVLAERGRLLLWAPVAMAVGIGGWFSWPSEPPLGVYWGCGLLVALTIVTRIWLPEKLYLVLLPWAWIAAGVLACGLRLWVVEAPVLEHGYYGPVTGRVIAIDRSQSDALRITLDQPWLDRVAPDMLPKTLRITLRGKDLGHMPQPGERVMITARLGPPSGPSEPDGFDFRRSAFFDGLGAVGYASSSLVLWETSRPYDQLINRMRSYLSSAMLARMPSQAGAYATGAMTGDRSAITQDTVRDLRDSSLAHLLAISGMNLAFLIAFVFGMIRYGLAFWPWFALRVNTKKVAAVCSLLVAGFYLALSGANVATERAFIMVCVVLGAVLLDRKALSLRSVALAAVALLAGRPESLLDAGFQMSFAATIALIAGFRLAEQAHLRQRLSWGMMPIATLLLSSVIGGIATAPYAAAHFNRYAAYGLIANLLTVPVMGAVVMPAGAMAALLGPLGLAGLPLWAMERGSAWILYVAHWVARWDGAVWAIKTAPMGALGLISLAGIWLVLARARARSWAVAPLLAGLMIWMVLPRPDLLIAGNGAVIGLQTPEGRAISRGKGEGFTAQSWLEDDGDLETQATAALRPAFHRQGNMLRFTLGAWQGGYVTGKGRADCDGLDLLILSDKDASATDANGCRIISPAILRKTGALAIRADGAGLAIKSVAAVDRRWTPPHLRAPQAYWGKTP